MARCYNYADCFEEASPGSLWGPKCRAAQATIHGERHAPKAAAAQAAVVRINAEDAAATLVECEGRCGKLVSNARRMQTQDVEQLRRTIQRKLMTGEVQVDGGAVLDSFQAYCRAIELTAPHRLQQARNRCDDCQAKSMADSVIFLGDSPSAPAAAPMKGEEHGQQGEASRPDE